MRRRCRLGLAVGLATVLSSGTLPAQARARLHGLAYDSLLGGPLVGATVLIQGFPRTAVTDSAGGFDFDSISPGRHIVILADSELDAVGLPNLVTAVEVPPPNGGPATFTMTVPSIGTLWRRLCGDREIGADSGIVFGTVRDVDSGTLLAGAVVDVFWPKLRVTDSLQVRLEERSDSATSDSTGSYHVCGVATGVAASARARAAWFFTGTVQLTAGPRPLARRDFAVSRLPAAGGQWRSMIHGRVEAEDGRPIPGARVALDGADSTVADGRGVFLLAHLPGGTQWLRSRAVGFAPLDRPVDLRSRDTTKLRIQLQAIAVLDTITTLASGPVPRAIQEFQERRRVGFGYSLAEPEIKKAVDLRSVLQRMPAVIVGPRIIHLPMQLGIGVLPPVSDRSEVTPAGTFIVYMRRGGVLDAYCQANLFIDGIGSPWEQLADYKPEDIVGIEVYPRQSLVPVRYQKISSGCGAVLVWTKYLR